MRVVKAILAEGVGNGTEVLIEHCHLVVNSLVGNVADAIGFGDDMEPHGNSVSDPLGQYSFWIWVISVGTVAARFGLCLEAGPRPPPALSSIEPTAAAHVSKCL